MQAGPMVKPSAGSRRFGDSNDPGTQWASNPATRAKPDARLAEGPLASSALQAVMLVAYAAVMFGVCMLACIVPTRRALRVQPTVALRAE